jgi:hypothetical protein
MIKTLNRGCEGTVHRCRSRQAAKNNILGVAYNTQRLRESSNQAQLYRSPVEGLAGCPVEVHKLEI